MKEEMEKQKYEEIRSAVEKNREMVHDTKNHYLVICEYIQNEKYDCLKNYVADIQKILSGLIPGFIQGTIFLI